MPNNYVSKLLKLKEYVIDDVKNCTDEIEVYCHSKKRGMWFEGQYSRNVAEIRTRRIPHIMIENQRVILVVVQRRFVFKGTRRWEKLPDVEKKKQTTNTFRLHTLRELQRDNYSGSGFKRKMSNMFPMKLLDDLNMEIEWPKGVKRIGLDGKAVKGSSMVHHLADIDRGKSIVIFPDLDQKQLKKNFMR